MQKNVNPHAKAGIQTNNIVKHLHGVKSLNTMQRINCIKSLDFRLRGNDEIYSFISLLFLRIVVEGIFVGIQIVKIFESIAVVQCVVKLFVWNFNIFEISLIDIAELVEFIIGQIFEIVVELIVEVVVIKFFIEIIDKKPLDVMVILHRRQVIAIEVGINSLRFLTFLYFFGFTSRYDLHIMSHDECTAKYLLSNAQFEISF